MDHGRGARRRQGEERRQAIIDVALRLFGEQGFDGTSIRDIAREVGVTEGLLYHYFESKSDLVHAICRERGWRARLGQVLAEAMGMPLEAGLREVTRQFLESLVENRHIVRLLVSELHRDPALAERHLREIEASRSSIVASLEPRRRSGELRPDADVRAAVGLLLGSAYSLFALWGEFPVEQWRELTRSLLEDGVALVARAITADGSTAEACRPVAT
ncbi:MAG TPA: TetR/AcrR family transcriptional regulator [Chthonomonadales bacterium]|nr:TetR/AcrR family transcriptional regulator [Chthonomonadales bacterium]